MPDYKPNQFVRVFAVLALGLAFVAIVAVIATSPGGSDGGNDNGSQVKTTAETKRGRAAVDRGAWIVQSGDTLGHIAEETGIDVDTLAQLNPNIDPQVLHEGQRIKLH
jgi:LysM repeat protein